jgi:hypothetical protein
VGHCTISSPVMIVNTKFHILIFWWFFFHFTFWIFCFLFIKFFSLRQWLHELLRKKRKIVSCFKWIKLIKLHYYIDKRPTQKATDCIGMVGHHSDILQMYTNLYGWGVWYHGQRGLMSWMRWSDVMDEGVWCHGGGGLMLMCNLCYVLKSNAHIFVWSKVC